MATVTAPPARRPDLILRPLGNDGRVVVKDPATGNYFNLEAPEAFLLERMDGRQGVDDICASFEARFGDALTPDAIDSAVKLFRGTSARDVESRLRHVPPDASRPGALYAGHGYVDIVNLGPHASRLVETITWEVAEGDTLQSIAESVYGDAAKVDRIINANRNQLGDGQYIHAGQRLRIPPA